MTQPLRPSPLRLKYSSLGVSCNISRRLNTAGESFCAECFLLWGLSTSRRGHFPSFAPRFSENWVLIAMGIIAKTCKWLRVCRNVALKSSIPTEHMFILSRQPASEHSTNREYVGH